MANKLHLKITHKAENLPAGFEGNTHAWGVCELHLESKYGHVENLLSVEWHMKHLLTWFLNSYFHGAYALLDGQMGDESNAQALKRLRKIETLPNKTLTKLLNYGKNHNITYGFPSMATPHIVIGYRDGYGEISFVDDIDLPTPHMGKVEYKIGDWSYSFEVKDFLKNTLLEIRDFLKLWLSFDMSEEQKTSVELLMNQLHIPMKYMGIFP